MLGAVLVLDGILAVCVVLLSHGALGHLDATTGTELLEKRFRANLRRREGKPR